MNVMASSLNRFTSDLRDICADAPLKEKWIIAPSLRVGLQWLEAVAASGQPVLNVHIKTLQHVALDLAAAEMNTRGLRFLRGVEAELIAYRVFALLAASCPGYLSTLTPSPGLIGRLMHTLQDLSSSGLNAGDLAPGHFEEPRKGRELAALLESYEEELRRGKLADRAAVLRMAAAALRESEGVLPDQALAIAPVDLLERLRGLERELWEAIAETGRMALEVDGPPETTTGEYTDAALLAWVGSPSPAPAPGGDGTARIFRAVGEINEVREVFRSCMEQDIAFDEVELLYTDSETYLPLIYEAACALRAEMDDPLPVTFLEGIPVRYSRPARALIGWLAWMAEDHSQATLVRLIKDGLLEIPQLDDFKWSFQRLGAMLASLPIGKGREHFTRELSRKVQWSAERLSQADEEREAEAETRARTLDRNRAWKALQEMVDGLLHCTPSPGEAPQEQLAQAADFLRTRTRTLNQFDMYSRGRMLELMDELRSCLAGEQTSLDVRQWLIELARSTKVGGQGPRPGTIFAAPLRAGGFSGRPHTFLIGLDDSRFPGTGRQDPLMLDGERKRISPDLPTGADHLSGTAEDLERLLARLRGKVILGYCCRSLTDDREMFPTPALISAYRILANKPEGQLADFLSWLPERASFAPNVPDRCASSSEWWLWRTCSAGPVAEIEKVITEHFPHLGRGFEARRARASDTFTVYDGYVAEAGVDCDPAAPGGPALSATRLETLARSPMDYFCQYVLEIAVPDEYKLDPSVWLDPAQRGDLLHEVFRAFMTQLIAEGRSPGLARDIDRLHGLLDEQIEVAKRKVPPLSPDVFHRQVRELRRTAEIFLRDAEQHCGDSSPLCCETIIGWPTEGPVTFLCSEEPVPLELGDGRVIRIRGKIDRIDERSDGSITVWDYKTGRRIEDKPGDPFRGGRRMQNFLYYEIVSARLAKERPGSRLVSFGYLFVNPRHFAERVVWEWNAERRDEGARLLGLLCELAASGCFPCSTKVADMVYSDYAAVLGDRTRAAADSERKRDNLANEVLAPWRELKR